MKKLLPLVYFMVMGVFAQQHRVKFAGQIENPNGDYITITGKNNFSQSIKVTPTGSFSSILLLPEPGLYSLYDGFEYADVYLKGGYDLYMTLNTKMFDETIKFRGSGERENNFLMKMVIDSEAFDEEYSIAADYKEKVDLIKKRKTEIKGLLDKGHFDSDFKSMIEFLAELESNSKLKNAIEERDNKKFNGKPLPDFEFDNFEGGKTKLSDFKNKYLFIDVWATWCMPCHKQMPYLKYIEDKYKGDNIVFVSISVDYKKDYDKWRNIVSAKQLGGVQLITDKDFNSKFIKALHIDAVPRFILVGPDGTVIDADAPKPSERVLMEVLDKHLK